MNMWDVINANPGIAIIGLVVAGLTTGSVFRSFAIALRGHRPRKQVIECSRCDCECASCSTGEAEEAKVSE